jgi:fimbrial chaperone protein
MLFNVVCHLRCCVFSCGMLLSLTLYAFGFTPTLLSLSTKEPIASLTISNEADEAVTLQIRPVRWLQESAASVKEIYKASDELIVTPVIFSVPAHGLQVVRMGLEHPIFGEKEQAFRIFVQEVRPEFPHSPRQSLSMVLRISLPVIVRTTVPIRQALRWHSQQLQSGYLAVEAENIGNNVLFVNEIELLSANKKSLSQPLKTFAYLLPGTHRRWSIPVSKLDSMTLIKASVNDQIAVFNGH